MTIMNKDVKKVLIDQETLQSRIKELGKEISKDYIAKDLLLICVLKGAVLFMADLAQNIEVPLEMDFMAISSYGNSTESSGVVRIVKDLETSIEGRDLLIVEDIVDSGLTLSYLSELLKGRGVRSLKICTLLEKPARKATDITIDYVGFQVPDEFVVGYGLDYAEKYRNLPYIGVLKEEVYQQNN
ncbi:hypoxanthine phosphoribosyltransferase [Garciella nitratireducens]|uniref:Hypoxanthine phosphoribosyltransferase n=1 Tax=Garciella nitratireducens DSM 15102 TaxID=1121911 RepID=A0A1T4L5L5_9FIRM|nr:hypoxanthine phosphoribosyltransferase [Garciella nitratireducens]SJZ50032.1 hypoxanthine phosphoribosyltransferase [Garciella nitratireducens DSM 15102]